MWVRCSDQEDSPKEEMATHVSILALRIPRTKEPGRLHSPQGRKESEMTEATYHAYTRSHIAFLLQRAAKYSKHF